MNASDQQYLSRFSLDPEEDPCGVDLYLDFFREDEIESFDDPISLETEDQPPADDFLFEN